MEDVNGTVMRSTVQAQSKIHCFASDQSLIRVSKPALHRNLIGPIGLSNELVREVSLQDGTKTL
jgi:hypothetical protein